MQRSLAPGILLLVASLCARAAVNALQQQSGPGSQSTQNPPAQKQPAQVPQSTASPNGTIPLQAPAAPQQSNETLRTVVIDPGHGGADTGSRGATGVAEKDIVMDLAREVAASLRAAGFSVVMTRIADVDPSLDERAAVANAQTGSIFISLHVGSAGPAGTVRTYTYAFPSALPSTMPVVSAPPDFVPWREAQQVFVAQSRKLGDLVQVELAQKFKGSPEISSSAPVVVLRPVTAPAVAIEISNISEDQQRLEDMGADLAGGIARAVLAYRSVYPPEGK